MAVTSRPSTQNVLTGFINLPLSKFSWAVDSPERLAFSWQHTMGNLTLVIDSFRSSSLNPRDSRTLKVIQGEQLMENVEIVEKVKESRTAMAHASQFNITLERNHLPTGILHRRAPSLIALKYRLPDGMMRRIQMKFCSDQDFQTVLSFFESIGCPVFNSTPPGEHVAVVAATPSKQTTSGTTPSHHAAYTGTIETFQSSSPRSFVIAPTHASLPLVDVSDLSNTARTGPLTGQVQMPTDGGQHPAQADEIGRRLLQFQLPFTSPSYLRDLHVRSAPSLALGPEPRDQYHQVPSTSSHAIDNDSTHSDPVSSVMTALATVKPLQHSASDGVMPSIPSFKLSRREVSTPAQLRRRSNDTAEDISPLHHLLAQNSFRLSTASSHHEGMSIDDLMPPKRDLPFKRPSSSRPSTKDLPPLPKPNFTTGKMNERGTHSSFGPAAGEGPKTANGTASHPKPTTTKTSPNPDSLRDTTNSNNSRQTSSVQNLPHTSTKASVLGDDRCSEQFSHSANHRQNVSRSNPTTAGTSTEHPQKTSTDKALERVAAAIEQSTKTADKENLTAYAAQPYEDRMKALDSMVVDLISDDNFITFCEDLNSCWRRIGLEH